MNFLFFVAQKPLGRLKRSIFLICLNIGENKAPVFLKLNFGSSVGCKEEKKTIFLDRPFVNVNRVLNKKFLYINNLKIFL